MKKLISFLLAAILFYTGFTADAEHSAEIPSLTTPTDIRVMLDGREIPSVCVFNEMFICADILDSFGYTLTYDDSVRALIAVKNSFPKDGVQTGLDLRKPQEVTFSDISVVINGNVFYTNPELVYEGVIPTTVVVGGMMYVSANAVSNTPQVTYRDVLGIKWDGQKRVLYLTNEPSGGKEQQEKEFINAVQEDGAELFGWHEGENFKGEGFEIISCYQSGTPHGTYYHYKYIEDSGRSVYLNPTFRLYNLSGNWGKIEVFDFRIEGRTLYFGGNRNLYKSGEYKTGEYALDLDTMTVKIISEKDY